MYYQTQGYFSVLLPWEADQTQFVASETVCKCRQMLAAEEDDALDALDTEDDEDGAFDTFDRMRQLVLLVLFLR